ncbi:uncharacterized protein BCR38DRAFT_226434 [Pseudomassariella vexata]|uniref:Uncharacterized protein n=1 Tax=Pseudomassariella vexata TaxID=1141098 RepID=A0A1Y2DW05_9PEZI|nr:uncharacterized protein BCR38DRAFT_226434 [Pseudomassariella vexata]ORY63294.1 hypothetical protein BCR38DRAFT_226434 [Pseudomassariella vexata]
MLKSFDSIKGTCQVPYCSTWCRGGQRSDHESFSNLNNVSCLELSTLQGHSGPHSTREGLRHQPLGRVKRIDRGSLPPFPHKGTIPISRTRTMVLEVDSQLPCSAPFGPWPHHCRQPVERGTTVGRWGCLVRVSASAPNSPLDQALVLQVPKHDPEAQVNSAVGPLPKPASKSAPVSPRHKAQSSPPQNCTSPNAPSESSGLLRPNDGSKTNGASESITKSTTLPSYASTSASTRSCGCGAKSWTNPFLERPPKRRRALHDVDGPGTGHLACKKRRIRLDLITSRLSQPYSLPATHILNRESGEDTPVLSRFLKYAAMGAKRAGHQTALVRKAAILNRMRLNVRQAAVNRGHERIWRLAGTGIRDHGVQLVTGISGTGAMFPGRPGAWEEVSVLPAWRPHTRQTQGPGEAERSLQYPGTPPIIPSPSMTATRLPPSPAPLSVISEDASTMRPPRAPRLSPLRSPILAPTASIMTPMAMADDDGEAFDGRYADMSDDDMDDVYADFETLFGGGQAGDVVSPERGDQDDHFYEEYLDEVDGIAWAT